MNFLAPAAFFFAALLPLVVLMYLLKLKRKRVVIPSTLLWRRAVEDLIANAPFQKLRNNLLLYIQLLILALLIAGLARPTMRLQAKKGQTQILLFDVSASMQALNKDGKPRIERAREAALRIVDSLRPQDQMILVAFSNKTQVVQTMTADKEALRQAVRKLQPADTDTDLREASLILTDLTTSLDSENKRIPREDTQTILVSDGALGPSAAMLTDIPRLEYVCCADNSENAGLTELDIRQSFAGAFEYQVFANVFNSGEKAIERMVELSVNGEVLDMKRVSIEPQKAAGVVFTTGEPLRGVAQVALQETDGFPLDNIARGILAPKTGVNVLLVTRSNYFLEQVFNMDSHIQLSRVTPGEYQPRTDYDLTVFDGCSFPNLPPGNYLFINSIPEGMGYKTAPESIQRPVILDWNRIHPLTRFVNLEKIIIQTGRKLEIPPAAAILAESENTPMLVLQEKDQLRMLIIPFDIRDSDWPLQVSFPIFISNVLDYFARSLQTTSKPLYRTGEIVPIYSDKQSSWVSVRNPAGQETRFPLDLASTVYFTQTAKAGVYQMQFEKAKESQPFTVNLLSENESNLAPIETLNLGGVQIKGHGEVIRSNQEVWSWLVLAALALLTLEWLIYCRRTWA